MLPKISVVIPCYNCEKYIERCVKSILCQSYSNLEIITVNDGSTDNTEKVLQKYLKDERIVYIKKLNGGEASARNAGVDAATGEFLGFVDSDDYVDKQMYMKLFKTITETGSDMAIANYNQVYDDGIEQYNYSTMTGKTFDLQEDILSYWVSVCAASHPNNYVWSRLYKTEIVKKSHLRFDKYIHSSDTLFNFKLLPFLKKCALVNEGLYNYCQRPDSGIHTVAKKSNIADLYADTLQELADYYNYNHYDAFKCVLPIHAYTRMKNVFFYSRLAGIPDDEIVTNLFERWKNRDILKYFLGEFV